MGLTCFINVVSFLYLIFAVFIRLQLYMLVFLVTSSLHLLSYLKIATVRHLGFLNFRIFVKNKIHICAYFYIDMQNLVKIGRSAAELLRIFDFQNGGRLPSWIFIFSQYSLAPISTLTSKIVPKWIPILSTPPKGLSLGVTTSYEP